MRAIGLDRENSETIGFVMTSLFCSAIDLEDLKQWCYHIIGELETSDTPGYVFDLLDYNGSLAKIDKVLGFVPSWKHSDKDVAALYGIAAKRCADRFDWPVDEQDAMTALADLPEIESRFRETFPFIEHELGGAAPQATGPNESPS